MAARRKKKRAQRGMSMRHQILVVVLLLVILLAMIAQYVIRPDRKASFAIVYAGGIQGAVAYATEQHAGYEKIAAIADKLSLEQEKVLILDAGDCLGANEFSEIEEGSSVISLMNTTGYEAMVPGTLDFVYGIGTLSSLRAEASFPFVACNLMKSDGTCAFENYKTINVGKVRIGITGVTTGMTDVQAEKDSLNIIDPLEAVKRVASELDGKVDALIVLAYTNDEKVISGLLDMNSVSLVIQGGQKTNKVSKGKDGTLLVSAGSGGNVVGVASVKVTKDHMDIQNIFYGANDYDAIASNAAVGNAVSDKIQQQAGLNNTFLGMIAVPEKEEESASEEDPAEETETTITNNVEETATGNLVADAILDAAGMDNAAIAMIPDRDIYGSLPNGSVTQGDVYSLFDDTLYVVTCKMTGGDIRSLIEASFNQYPQARDFLQIAGMSYHFDKSTGIGSHISEFYVGDNKLDDARTYVIAMTNDMASSLGFTSESSGMINVYHSVSYIVSQYIQTQAQLIEGASGQDVSDSLNYETVGKRIRIK